MSTLQMMVMAWWAQRQPRERRLLSIGAVVVLIALFYQVLIAPAVEGIGRIEASLPGLQRQLGQMQAQALIAQRLSSGAQGVAPTGDALQTGLTAALTDAGLGDASAVAPAGNGVRVTVKQVSFAALVRWLDQMRTQLKVKVADAQVTPVRAPDGAIDGRVDAVVTLEGQRGSSGGGQYGGDGGGGRVAR
ncbi:type II secretion system protein GspM [Robbsia andropogonis]|uniref:type II secretion system protein GspM n=1 Tax=Robbsia andropogonis TaxID=28092 RepID=UPI000467778F|nr:type II secretion system protein M [Robbsia andropogonis]MCP1119008.1 type II secretion system protein M [Robbsia andropogonis]MCP1128640.1 type II secretion system protein M [Robbsia andropogonis]